MLSKGHRLTNPPSFRKALAARDPANTNAPGLEGNKNGPPGPEGNRKRPPGDATSTEQPASPTSQTLPSDTEVSSPDNIPPPPASSIAPPATPALITTSTLPSSPGLTLSSVVVISVFPTLSTNFRTSSVPATQSVLSLSLISTSSRPAPSAPGIPTTPSAPAASGAVAGTLTSATPSVESLTIPDVSASSDEFSSTAKYSVSGSLPSTLSATLFPVETTLRTSIAYTSSATAIQTGMVYYAWNGTVQSEYSAAPPGQKAGIAVGTIASFAFILILIFLFFKQRRAELPEVLPNPLRRPPGTWGKFRWLSRSQTPDVMSDSLLPAEVGSSGSPAWDYQATFARPTVIEKARRSLRKSLTGLRQGNPLGQNPQARKARIPRAASTYRGTFRRSFLQGQSGSVTDPQSPPPLPPLYAALPSPRPPTLSGRPTEPAQSDTDDSPRPLTMPPQTLQLPWHHRNSHMTAASAESESCSFKSVPGWVKFYYPHRLRSSGGEPQESEKALPLPPLVSPGSWLKGKILRRPYSTTGSEDKKGHHMASDSGGESAGTEQAAFGQSGWKQVWMGQRISGASADSLVAEKQEG
ncbi:hypothetical protein BKA61DRAFT_738707 [Leptodontidium sp. MPI-SDFR-AT-0119]|nr:hypothetical protein BKA61DRAFT_738707 [Leptodontidium sp. MPI-SDFR-AT-0119]